MKEAVAQPFGFAGRELAGERQCLGPGDQVVRDEDELEPDGVEVEVAEGEVPHTAQQQLLRGKPWTVCPQTRTTIIR